MPADTDWSKPSPSRALQLTSMQVPAGNIYMKPKRQPGLGESARRALEFFSCIHLYMTNSESENGPHDLRKLVALLFRNQIGAFLP